MKKYALNINAMYSVNCIYVEPPLTYKKKTIIMYKF